MIDPSHQLKAAPINIERLFNKLEMLTPDERATLERCLPLIERIAPALISYVESLNALDYRIPLKRYLMLQFEIVRALQSNN